MITQFMELYLEQAGFDDKQKLSSFVPMKLGMTNQSYSFEYDGKKYILRVPGKGTERIINRLEEWKVYAAIKPLDICDSVCYFDRESGVKISRFLENARVCNDRNPKDIECCMHMLRVFHEKNLEVEHHFDYWERMEYYESLCNGSIFPDYDETKKQVYSLKKYIDIQPIEYCLCHIDSVSDNFLFFSEKEGTEEIRIIDWEYAAMQDPHFDIAMFAIYSMYDRAQIEALIQYYFPEGCSEAIRLKIYCYVAIGGLLWSNWCEYKRICGLELGEYAEWQYRYAHDYPAIFKKEYELIYGKVYE